MEHLNSIFHPSCLFHHANFIIRKQSHSLPHLHHPSQLSLYGAHWLLSFRHFVPIFSSHIKFIVFIEREQIEKVKSPFLQQNPFIILILIERERKTYVANPNETLHRVSVFFISLWWLFVWLSAHFVCSHFHPICRKHAHFYWEKEGWMWQTNGGEILCFLLDLTPPANRSTLNHCPTTD